MEGERVRVVHVSDTHLGHSAYRRMDPGTGLNQREMDVFRAFDRFVDAAIALEPDAVVHSGDLFDSVRPSNRALYRAIDGFKRIADAGIPVVVISGNHSTPRLRETGSPLRLLEHIPSVTPVFRGAYERVDIGDLHVHCVPHGDKDATRANLQAVSPCDGYNVLMLHAAVVGLRVFRMDEFNESIVNTSFLDEGFDHIALGHYHGCTQVTDNAWYSGSTERLSFAEADQEKGFLEVDLDSRDVTFHSLDARGFTDIGPLDANGMDVQGLRSLLMGAMEGVDVDDKVVRLTVDNVAPSSHRGLDTEGLRAMASGSVHFELRVRMVDESVSIQSGGAIGSVRDEFVRFLDRYPLERVPRERLESLGLEYMERRSDA